MNVLGIDAGGTKTRVVYGPVEGLLGGRSMATALMGPGNYRHLGNEGVIRMVRDIIDHFSIPNPEHTMVVAGFSGAGTEESEALIRTVFREEGFVHPHVLITSDVGLLLRALRNHGILVISGTGSICMGRIGGRDDSTVRAGGWGYRLGDAGSGYSLGLKAIEVALRIEDGVLTLDSSVLYDGVRSYFDLEHLNTITDILYPDDSIMDISMQERIAGLAGLVIEAAYEGDKAAGRIVSDSVDALAEYIHAVYKRLGVEDTVVGLYGGVFKHRLADAMMIKPIRTNKILGGLPLNFKMLGLKETDPDPLIEAIDYSLSCW